MMHHISLKFSRRKNGKTQYKMTGQIRVVGPSRSDVEFISQNIISDICRELNYCKNLLTSTTEPLKQCYVCVRDFEINIKYGERSEKKQEVKKLFVKLKKKQR